MVKKERVSVRMSDVPWNVWLRIVLVKPGECRNIFIPRGGTYVVYKAYFVNDYIKKTRVFDMVFPLNQIERAFKAIPPELKAYPDRPVRFEFMKVRRSIHIRNWECL